MRLRQDRQDAHALIKIQFVHGKESTKDLSTQIAPLSKSQLVGLIGNIAILTRRMQMRKNARSAFRESESERHCDFPLCLRAPCKDAYCFGGCGGMVAA
jgi:hypothetical protein